MNKRNFNNVPFNTEVRWVDKNYKQLLQHRFLEILYHDFLYDATQSVCTVVVCRLSTY